MIRIAMLTAAYPYLPGEQFVEEEIRHWSRQPGVELVLMPLSAQGEPRALPANVQVDLSFCHRRAAAPWLRYFARAACSAVLWKELAWVVRNRGANPSCLARAGYATANLLRTADALSQPLQSNGGFDLVYCYWNDTWSLAPGLLKRKGLLPRWIARIHNFELYEHDAPANYLPLKRQFIRDIDRIVAISNQGARYLRDTFDVPAHKLRISRLGVRLPANLAPVSPAGELHLVSIAYCWDYKRIDVIIDALARFASSHPHLKLRWTHIGDGPLYRQLLQHARATLAQPNLQWQMPGYMDNAAVRALVASQPVDVLVNASRNEGVPVSIMEAMSAGIPAVAPAVGGIAELVSNDCGRLLNSDPDAGELAAAIADLLPELADPTLRLRAIDKIRRDYNADTNFPLFVSEVLGLARAAPRAQAEIRQPDTVHAHSSTFPD